VLFLAVIVFLIFGCSEDKVTAPQEEIEETTDLVTRVERTNDFAVDLYLAVRETRGNLILSPHSTSVAFAMLYAGARGLTEIEISDVMRFHYPQENGFHPAMSLLNEQICSRGQSNPGEFRIWLANGCWIDREYPVLQSYKDTLTCYYDAEIDTVDFLNDPGQARDIINDWIYDKTDHMMQDAVPEGVINPLTVMVLSNVFCFEAKWLKCFDTNCTYNKPFHLLDGSTKTVLTMHGEHYFDFYDGDGYKAVRLPYEGDSVSMLLLLPDEGCFTAFEDTLSSDLITSVRSSLVNQWVLIGLPRFHIETELYLNEVLKSMGMTSSFDPGADFSGIDGIEDGEPWISHVHHKTLMYLNEYGTYMYSTTGIYLTVGVHPEFRANRPFIFAVIDEPTGAILFIGRVLDANGYYWPFL
jgi:serpin B